MQMYGLAEEALVGVQQELEARLKPPQELQDGLYAAKGSLPVPPDPIRNALDAFAKKALGDIGRHLPPLYSQCWSSMLLCATLSACQAHMYDVLRCEPRLQKYTASPGS